jgi:hypothetical protein
MATATSAGAATTAGDVDRIRGPTIAIAVPQHECKASLVGSLRGGVEGFWIDLIPELENTENASSQMQCLTSSPTDRRGTPRLERRLQIACGHNFRTKPTLTQGCAEESLPKCRAAVAAIKKAAAACAKLRVRRRRNESTVSAIGNTRDLA